MLESSLGLIFVRMYGRRLVTRIRGFLAALFCDVFVHLDRHLVWGEGMYARGSRAYVVATEW